MLDFLRRNSSSIFIQLIFVVIVVVFVFWGMGSGSAPRQTVAKVGGKAIKDSEFARAYRNEVYRQQRMRELKEQDYEQIKAEVIDDLVTREVLLQQAERQGIRVSDHELRQSIMKMPAFLDDDGKFSPSKYQEILDNNNMEAGRFEMDLRDDLMVQRLQQVIRRSVLVSPDEVREDYRRRNEKVDLEFVRVSHAAFRDQVSVEDAQVDAWLATNLQKVQDHYNSRYDADYNKPRQVKTSHVLLRVEESDTQAARAKVAAKAAELAKRAATEDFATLARRYGEDHTARRSGDLGWVDERRGGAPFNEESFKKALADLEAGEVSGVVETTQGYEVLRAEEVREAKVTSFDEAKRDIARKLMVDEQVPALARAYADRLAKPFAAGEDAAAILEEKGLKVQETGEFAWNEDRVPRLGQSAELASTAFALREPGRGPEQVFEIGGGALAVVRLKSRTDADMAAFEEEAESTRDALQARKQAEMLEAWIEALKEQAEIKRYDVRI